MRSGQATLLQQPEPRTSASASGSLRGDAWLTPSANEDAAGTPRGNMQKMLGNDPVVRTMDPQRWATGVLSPAWVEHLMGWHTLVQMMEAQW